MDELQWQSKICGLIREGGGYAKKWASDLNVGVPDIVAAIPEIGGILLEVKYEKDWTTNTSRTIKITPLQIKSLLDYQRRGGRSAVLVVVQTGLMKHKFYLCSPPNAIMDRLVVSMEDVNNYGLDSKSNLVAYLHVFFNQLQGERYGR